MTVIEIVTHSTITNFYFVVYDVDVLIESNEYNNIEVL